MSIPHSTNRYTIKQSYSNGSTLSLTEPLSPTRMMGLLETLLESQNLTEIQIKRVTINDLTKLCVSWLSDEWRDETNYYKAMILDENSDLWPFPLIILDNIPKSIVDDYNNNDCESVIRWLWINEFTEEQKRHLMKEYDNV